MDKAETVFQSSQSGIGEMKPTSRIHGIGRTAYNIICFSFMPWSAMWKRNQSMMALLAKSNFVNKVIFVSPHVSIRNIFKRKGRNSHISFSVSDKLFPRKRTPNLWEYTPVHFLPLKGHFTKLELIETRMMLQIIRQLNAGMPYVLFMNCPNIYSTYLLDELLKKAELSIFDFSDDFVELVHTRERKEFFSRNIAKCAQAADIVLTVNNHLKNKYAFLNANIHVVRNATNYYNFDRKCYKTVASLERIKSNNHPIIGYSGWINSSRIDFNLLDFLLENRPNWQYVFIGPADSDFIVRYTHHKNVHHLSAVHYKRLPDYIHYFDVAVVPFKVNEHTRGNDLLKFYDYLAMGKPIVSTDVAVANNLRSVIRIAKTPADFLEEVEKAIVANTSEEIVKRQSAALMNSWHERIKVVEGLIKNGLGMQNYMLNCRIAKSCHNG